MYLEVFLLIHLNPIFVVVIWPLGSMENEEDVLDWMVGQKEDESIEEIDRETLNQYITTKDFLAVVFCKCLIFVQ